MWSDWERDRLNADARRIGEARKVLAVFLAIVDKPRNRMGVIDAGADAGGVETPNDLRPLTGQRAVKHRCQTIVAAGLAGGSDIENSNMLETGQPLLQYRKVPRTALQDRIEALELLTTDLGIDVAQAIVGAERKHIIHARNVAV